MESVEIKKYSQRIVYGCGKKIMKIGILMENKNYKEMEYKKMKKKKKKV